MTKIMFVTEEMLGENFPKHINTCIICGGRNYNDEEYLFSRMDELNRLCPIRRVVTGEARGADKLGKKWALAHYKEYKGYSVDILIDGPWPAAGPRRNMRMLANEIQMESYPLCVVGFPGERGTAHMMKISKAMQLSNIGKLFCVEMVLQKG